MSRNRPLSRLEREIEDAEVRGTYPLIARELALTAARRWPQLSVDHARKVLALAAEQIVAADERASAAMAAAIRQEPASRMAKSVRNGGRSTANGRAGSLDAHLLKRVAGYRRAHPDQTNVARAFREIGPPVNEGNFRKYWKAVEPLLQEGQE